RLKTWKGGASKANERRVFFMGKNKRPYRPYPATSETLPSNHSILRGSVEEGCERRHRSLRGRKRRQLFRAPEKREAVFGGRIRFPPRDYSTGWEISQARRAFSGLWSPAS